MYKCFFKRLIDFIIALCTLAFIWPILLLITIWLHFANKGAGAFFTQERPGKDGRIFRVIKFKSMTDERDAEGKLLPDAKRLTHVGKFVRATSIDELPQLINVLKGDMALIGPRPLLPEYLPLYSKEQARRHEVRPGITGWAQVNGRNAITVLNSDGVLLSIDKTPNVKLINLHAFKWCIDSSKKVQYSNSGFFSNIKQYLGKFLFYISFFNSSQQQIQ
jgi:undecaprenyl phosphate N,N'-diacetylbacillosamine 1-phosphate transferase